MTQTLEFHYKVSGRSRGHRPGAHAGRTEGTGQLFATHRRLIDHPDPRRLDVRASLRDLRGDWLVRLARQRVAVPVHVIVDVSASMHLGTPRSKLQVAADFVEGLGLASFRLGDPMGLIAFDGVSAEARDDLHHPPRRGRGVGVMLAEALRALPSPPTTHAARTGEGLLDAAHRVGDARHDTMVFVVSDFHGISTAHINAAIETLWPAQLVPLLAWHPDETTPPEGQGLMPLADAESGRRRSLWMRPSLRQRWNDSVQARRQELQDCFDRHDCPLHALVSAQGAFDAEALTRYFQEQRL